VGARNAKYSRANIARALRGERSSAVRSDETGTAVGSGSAGGGVGVELFTELSMVTAVMIGKVMMTENIPAPQIAATRAHTHAGNGPRRTGMHACARFADVECWP